jgi:putative IMPACT (imprinted ancient) family translation regulator
MKPPSFMDTVKTTQERHREARETTGDSTGETVMTTASSINTEQSLLKAVPAANADRLADAAGQEQQAAFESTGAWDSYEVWRRFFKDARERRERNPN